MSTDVMFSLKDEELGRLQNLIAQYGSEAETVVYDAMFNATKEYAPERITALMPRSDRRKKHAKDSKWWQAGGYPSSLVTYVQTRSEFAYLYFPDDGSTTRRHAGLQNFMGRGGKLAWPLIIQDMENSLAQAWEEL